MSKEVNWFKQPDWEYIKKKYPEEYPVIKRAFNAGTHWFVTRCIKFNADYYKYCNGADTVYIKGELIPSKAVCGYYCTKEFGEKVSVGDKVDLNSLYLLVLNTLNDDGPIIRVSDVEHEGDCEDISRIKEIIAKEDTFRGCLRLY